MYILFIAFIIIIWWIGVWGLVETILHQYIKGSYSKAIYVYGSLVAFVLAIVYMYPELLERFT